MDKVQEIRTQARAQIIKEKRLPEDRVDRALNDVMNDVDPEVRQFFSICTLEEGVRFVVVAIEQWKLSMAMRDK